MVAAKQPTPEDLDAYMRMSKAEVVKLVLCLLIEDTLRGRLAAFRPQHLPAQPVEGEEKLGL